MLYEVITFFAQGGNYFQRAYIVRLWDAIHEKYPLHFYEERIEYLESNASLSPMTAENSGNTRIKF